jgi:acyl-coenzyme A thioesterase 9
MTLPNCSRRQVCRSVSSIKSSTDIFIRSALTPANFYLDNRSKMRQKEENHVQNKQLPIPTNLHTITKSISDSYIRMVLPFGSDLNFRNQFMNARGQLRSGKILEELDSFAGSVAYKHCDDGDFNTDSPTLVTASFDRVDWLRTLEIDVDVEMRGAVTFVGTSSLNIDIDLRTYKGPDAPGELVMMASTTFVARDRQNKAVSVPKLVPKNPAELALYEQGRDASIARRSAKSNSLEKRPPTSSELALVHTLFQELSSLGLNVVERKIGGSAHGHHLPLPDHKPILFMSSTHVSSMEITMPQERNLHGKLFGGFLVRRAFELAYSCGWANTGQAPKFLSMDEVTFVRPVEIGTLIRFDAEIDYVKFDPETKRSQYSVSVSCSSRKPGEELRDSTQLTNTFNFIFGVQDGVEIPTVYPTTYAEAMKYIEGYRRIDFASTLAKKRTSIQPRFE